MLININPILNPELLYNLRAMGHGDKLVLTDANFPAYSHSFQSAGTQMNPYVVSVLYMRNACVMHGLTEID